MRRGLVLFLVLAAFPAGAHAQGAGNATVTLNPAQAGKPTRLSLTATGDAVSSGQQPPKSVSLLVNRGFRIDPRSRAARCSAAQARAFNCPPASRIATGQARGSATVPVFGAVQFSADIQAFLAPRAQPGDIAGVVILARESRSGRQGAVNGRLLRVATGPFGTELRFENFDLANRQAPPGSSARLDSFTLSVQARRRVRKVRIVKRRVRTRRGTRIRRRRKMRIRRYYLIRNPRVCAGSWAYQVRATFPSAPEYVRDGSVPCAS